MDSDRMPFISADDIRWLIGFTRVFPLLVLAFVAVAYTVAAYTPYWVPGALTLDDPTPATSWNHYSCVAVDATHHFCEHQ